MLVLLLALCVTQTSGQLGCGQPRCGGYPPVALPRYYQPYGYQQQPAPLPAPQYYYHPTAVGQNAYALPPPQQVLAQMDKDPAVVGSKATTYEEFEKELEKLKPATIIKTDEDGAVDVKPPSNATNPAVTYIREVGYLPDQYFPRAMPYRPLPYLPRGCPVVGPTYYRPMPYMPRGYVQPVPAPVPAPTVILPPQPGYVTAPRPAAILPPPINDCCGRCGAPCKFRSRRSVIAALASKIMEPDFVPRRENSVEDEPKDPKCNSEQLRDLMNRYTTRTVSLSKRLIQKNAEAELEGFFSVFCSLDDFSYVARSELFCQNEKNGIICYAFKHS